MSQPTRAGKLQTLVLYQTNERDKNFTISIIKKIITSGNKSINETS